jgi:6-phospho-3-hexuloisomerase
MRHTLNVKTIVEELQNTAGKISEGETCAFVEKILSAERIFCTGSGRSGLMVNAFAMRLMQLGLCTYVVGETITPSIGKGDLLVIGSGSGETARLIQNAKKAKESRADIALVTIFPESSIGSFSDICVRIPASTAKIPREPSAPSAQPGGSLFEQCLLIFLDAVVMSVMRTRRIDPGTIMTRHANLE